MLVLLSSVGTEPVASRRIAAYAVIRSASRRETDHEQSLAAQEIANCTCLRLRRTARRVTQIYDQMLEPAGLTLAQFSLIAQLYAGEGLRSAIWRRLWTRTQRH